MKWIFILVVLLNLLVEFIHMKECLLFDLSLQNWNGGRNGKLCITVSKQSKLEISFSSKPQEFNPYCLIPSKISSQISSHSITSWCSTENNQVCIKYTLRYGSNKLIHFATIKENGKVICGSESTKPTTSKILSKATATTSTSKNICTAKYNYKEILHKSLLFYEAQRSGHLPKSNRISWRKNSMLNDGSSVGYNLTGGYFDAGDYVKFSFPMASAMTLLAWGMVEFRDGYKFAGEYQNGLSALKWGADYLIKCHTANEQLWVQVGDGHEDHKFWGRPEQYQGKRPCFQINRNKPGSDVAGEVSAALSATSVVFEFIDPRYSTILLGQAKQIYEFASKFRGKYSDSIPEVRDFYKSWSGYMDELVWSAAWLYKATKEDKYFQYAKKHWSEMDRGIKWANEVSWDNKARIAAILLAQTTKQAEYVTNAQSLCQWAHSDNSPKTTKGLLFINKWGANRYAANIAFACLAYSKYFPSKTFDSFSRKQIHLLLGDAGRSFVVGFGNNPPTRPHHSSSSCPNYPQSCGWKQFQTSAPNPQILYGALVGGPKNQNGDYVDSRQDYICNEVSLDYNAGFQSALAVLLSKQRQGDC